MYIDINTLPIENLHDVVEAAIRRVCPNYKQTPTNSTWTATPAELWDSLVTEESSQVPLSSVKLETLCECTAPRLINRRATYRRHSETIHQYGTLRFFSRFFRIIVDLIRNISVFDVDTSYLPPTCSLQQHLENILVENGGPCAVCSAEAIRRAVVVDAGVVLVTPAPGPATSWPQTLYIPREHDVIEYTLSSAISLSGEGQWRLTDSAVEGKENWCVYSPDVHVYLCAHGPCEPNDVYLNEERRWECLVCSRSYESRHSAAVHAAHCVNKRSRQCTDCGQWTMGEWEWANHRQLHVNGYAFRCRLGCDSVWFARHSDMSEHHERHHGVSYAYAKSQGLLPVPLRPSTEFPPVSLPFFSLDSIPRARIEYRICSHCGCDDADSWRFDDSDNALCRACYGYKRLNDVLPPPALLQRRRERPKRKTPLAARPRIWRKEERIALRDSMRTVICAGINCGVICQHRKGS